MPSEQSIVILTAQTDLGLRSRNFSLKSNKLPTFLKSLKRGNVKRLCSYGLMSLHTKFQLQIMFYTLDIDPTTGVVGSISISIPHTTKLLNLTT